MLTTVQVASRIHRMRRRKHRLPLSTQKALGFDITGTEIILLKYIKLRKSLKDLLCWLFVGQ